VARAELEIGNTIGDYEIVSLLGRGGMGKVFKVRNVLCERFEAMKCLLPDTDATPELAERFLREIKVLARLEHPHITSFRTAMRNNNRILMVMEYVEGSPLDRKMKDERIDLGRVIHYIRQVLEALGYAHRRGVLHRDVKPSNILVGADDLVKLTDFGIASMAGNAALTTTGSALGSLYYMSPEQMKAEPLDTRSDLYSVGVTLYELVTGQVPVKGDSFYAVLRAHLEGRPAPPRTIVPDLPANLSRVIEKSLEKAREARFQNAQEFHDALPEPGQCTTIMVTPKREPAAAKPTPQTPGSTTPLTPTVLDTATRNLARYIGPMARVLVGRAATDAKSVQDLYHRLAVEIPSVHDREQFLRHMPY